LGKFEDRLILWNQLRTDNQSNDLETALLAINDWWQLLPLDSHYLHWDEVDNWPDPWDLLSDGIFSLTSKSLGIVYTLHLINRPEINDLQFAQTSDGDNLVLVNQGKYILNWAPGEMLNTSTAQKIQITQMMNASVVTKKLD
jgi:hypothetical protein